MKTEAVRLAEEEIEPKCCGHKVHAQIEYADREKGPIESLIGVDLNNPQDVETVKDLLFEWLTAKRAMNNHKAPDHFIVYRNWPKA